MWIRASKKLEVSRQHEGLNVKVREQITRVQREGEENGNTKANHLQEDRAVPESKMQEEFSRSGNQ